MVGAKATALAFLLIAIFVASSTVPAEADTCFAQCYERCANGKVGDDSCTKMCAQACIVPENTPSGVDLDKLAAGVH